MTDAYHEFVMNAFAPKSNTTKENVSRTLLEIIKIKPKNKK